MKIWLKYIKIVILCLFLLIIIHKNYHLNSQESQNLSYDAFKRAEASIEKIINGRNRTFKFILKKVYLDEEEVNSYIHYKNPFRRPKELVKEWVFLKGDNQIEYQADFDLTNSEIKGLPVFLKGWINFTVTGELLSVEGKVKFKPKTFSINKATFPVSFLNSLLEIYYKAKGKKPNDIESFFSLPYGIRKIRVEKGRVALYY